MRVMRRAEGSEYHNFFFPHRANAVIAYVSSRGLLFFYSWLLS